MGLGGGARRPREVDQDDADVGVCRWSSSIRCVHEREGYRGGEMGGGRDAVDEEGRSPLRASITKSQLELCLTAG